MFLVSCSIFDKSSDGEISEEATLIELSEAIPEVNIIFTGEEVSKALTLKNGGSEWPPSNFTDYIGEIDGPQDMDFFLSIINFMVSKYKGFVKSNAHHMKANTPISMDQTEVMPDTGIEFNFNRFKFKFIKKGLDVYWGFYTTVEDQDTGEKIKSRNRIRIKIERDLDHRGCYIASFVIDSNGEGLIYFSYYTYDKKLVNYERWKADTGDAENYRKYYLDNRSNTYYRYMAYRVDPDATPNENIIVILSNENGKYVYDNTIATPETHEVYYDNDGNRSTPPDDDWNDIETLSNDWIQRAPNEMDKYDPDDLMPSLDSEEFCGLFD